MNANVSLAGEERDRERNPILQVEALRLPRYGTVVGWLVIALWLRWQLKTDSQ